MTTFVFDTLSSGPIDESNSPPAVPSPYLGFIRGEGSQVQTVSPNGTYVGGCAATAQLWVAKTTPAGFPSLLVNEVLTEVDWTGSTAGEREQDLNAFCIDDEGFVWGESYQWGTIADFPLAARERGAVGYVDPDAPTVITEAFAWVTSGTAAGNDPSAGFYLQALYTFTLADGTIKLIAIPQGGFGTDLNTLFYEHTKGGSTTTHDTSTWRALFAFQDDNLDIWVCGSVTAAATTIKFMRITSQSADYSTPQSITGFPSPATVGAPTDLRGYFAGGAFVGGYWHDYTDGLGNTCCGTLVKVTLDGTATVTHADTTATALVLPLYPVPADPTYYAVVKSSDAVASAPEPNLASRIFYGLNADLTLGTSYNLDSWAASDSGVDDWNTVHTVLWSDTRQAFIGYRWLHTDPPDNDHIQADLFIYYFGDAGGGGGGGVDEDVLLRVWGFSLDDHDFAVFRLGSTETLVFDLTTQQWAEWGSPELDYWRAHVGGNWVGVGTTTAARDFGTDVVAGDDTDGVLYILDPDAGRDDDPVTGTPATFTRRVTGSIDVRGRTSQPCYAVQLTASLGNPVATGASFTLRTSDDVGQTWALHGSNTLVAASYDQVLEWRALGLMRQPGRLFRIEDDGAAVRISGADLR